MSVTGCVWRLLNPSACVEAVRATRKVAGSRGGQVPSPAAQQAGLRGAQTRRSPPSTLPATAFLPLSHLAFSSLLCPCLRVRLFSAVPLPQPEATCSAPGSVTRCRLALTEDEAHRSLPPRRGCPRQGRHLELAGLRAPPPEAGWWPPLHGPSPSWTGSVWHTRGLAVTHLPLPGLHSGEGRRSAVG